MLKFFRNQKGFTLVELMIVVVIVGILAAVAIPMYTGQIKKARASEAEATLGSIRSSLRVMYAENREYPDAPTSGYPWDIVGIGIDSTDLVGKNFAATEYQYASTHNDSFTVTVTGTAAAVSGITRQINQDGDITD